MDKEEGSGDVDTSHWINGTGLTLTEEVLNESLGFIYRMTENSSGKIYIGRKQFWSLRNRVWYESDWRTYKSSSGMVQGLIERDGDSEWTFEILAVFSSKSTLRYAEAAAIIWSEAYISQSKGFNGEFAGCKGRIAATERDYQQLKHLENTLHVSTEAKTICCYDRYVGGSCGDMAECRHGGRGLGYVGGDTVSD